ncbi:hypothetical protein [Photobacterium leiognathi]|uniref:hypothetical protein n=1 Tax=Photobacterium leiognathi TaxID=553611 RepID=UPI0029817458|nr:hypothetical protein [Photobacterium leiognathi]
MLENIDLSVDNLNLIVSSHPKDLSEDTKNALIDTAKDKNLNVIEFRFRNENGEIKTMPVLLEDAIWSN